MAQQQPLAPATFTTSYIESQHEPSLQPQAIFASAQEMRRGYRQGYHHSHYRIQGTVGSTGKGILIGMLTAFGTALFAGILVLFIYFLRYTSRGRILLDGLRRPGDFDDEQAFAKEEAEALEEMDDIQRAEYMRAKAFVQANPPESVSTDISLSQFLAIQEKGVSAWEFEPELEIANCFVEGRTEIEFFDSECSVQSNLPIPKQNEVYYWEAKIFDKPESTMISIGLTTKPYPLFRLPGYHKTSIAYTSPGTRRINQPFAGNASYGPPYVQGDVIGVGYRPRNGSIFFTRNGKKLDESPAIWKTQNFFPTIGANGPCQVHVNFGQMGFVFIEANVKKWGLAPMTGSLAPPPPYGSEQGSILLEGGREGVREGMGFGNHFPAGFARFSHGRSHSAQVRSPGPVRSPTDISLAQLSLGESMHADSDAGEGTSASSVLNHSQQLEFGAYAQNLQIEHTTVAQQPTSSHNQADDDSADNDAPPDYESPESSLDMERHPLLGNAAVLGGMSDEERQRLLTTPIPTYDAAVAMGLGIGNGGGQGASASARGRSSTR